MTLRPHPSVEVLSTERLFQGRVFDLVRQELTLPSGLRQGWELIEHPGATAIAAVDERGRLLLVKQYRASVGDWMLEIPAGRLEPGEEPLLCAQRELEEETGYRASAWRPLGRLLPAPGFCSEVLHVFEARELEQVPDGGQPCDADEEIEVCWLDPREVLRQDPLDAKTVFAVHSLLLGPSTLGTG